MFLNLFFEKGEGCFFVCFLLFVCFLPRSCPESDNITNPWKNVNNNSQLETLQATKVRIQIPIEWTGVQLAFLKGGSFVTPALHRTRLRQERHLLRILSLNLTNGVLTVYRDLWSYLPYLLIDRWLFKTRLQATRDQKPTWKKPLDLVLAYVCGMQLSRHVWLLVVSLTLSAALFHLENNFLKNIMFIIYKKLYLVDVLYTSSVSSPRSEDLYFFKHAYTCW